MILRFDSRFDSTFFGFKIRFEDSPESSNLPNLKIRESYDSSNTENFQLKVLISVEPKPIEKF